MSDVTHTAISRLLSRGVARFDPKDAREFLPAALEVIETPPSPTGRLVMFTIIGCFSVALAWATFGQVDETATAPGRVIPAGRVKVVQPLDAGVVRQILAQDGAPVRAGQTLIVLDPTQTSADRDRLQKDRLSARLDVARLTALLPMTQGRGRAGSIAQIEGASAEDMSRARAALSEQVNAQQAKLASLGAEVEQKRAEVAEVQATISKTRASLVVLEEKERRYQVLLQQGFGSSFQYLEAQQQVIEARKDLDVYAQRLTQARAAVSALEKQRAQANAEFASSVLSDLQKARERDNELSQEFLKADEKASATELKAPIDGVVEQLAVHTVGGVVTPAEHLLTIVPAGGALVVEAQLANRDIGFVHVGQDVQVKIETFSFTRYGLIHGRVLSVSRDAVSPSDRAPDAGQAAATPGASPVASPSYTARIRLDQDHMTVDGRRADLMAGMAVTAEIRTGRRSVLDYLLSPLARRSQEALHER